MPPTPGLTREERAMRSFQKGAEQIGKGQLMRIHTALEKRTDVLSKVETFLVSLGVMDQSTLGVLPVMPVSGAQAKVDPKEDDDDLFGDGPGCEQGAKQETPDANGGTNGVGELVITREEQRLG